MSAALINAAQSGAQTPLPENLDPALLAMLAPLLGTLSGGQGIPALQAQQQQLSQQTQQAANAASQAGQQYQQGVQAPTEQVSPTEEFLTKLMSGTASVMSGNPDYQRQAHADLESKNKELMEKRKQNLEALRTNYENKAQAAERLGNTELAGEFRLKYETLSKGLQGILDQQRSALTENRLKALEEQRQGNREELAQLVASLRQRYPTTMGGLAGTDPNKTAEDIAFAMMGKPGYGHQPPTTVGMGRSGIVPLIRQVFAREGWDFSKATLDYEAVKRYLSTINGRQQVQIRQSALTADQALGNVLDLNDKLTQLIPRGNATVLNRLSVSAAKDWGAYGTDAQNTATQLKAQIADLIPELANVFQAGGVPTDQAMKTARDQLNENWSPAQLKAAVTQLRQNLRYRLNSIQAEQPVDAMGQPILMPSNEGSGAVLAGDIIRLVEAYRSGDRATWDALVAQNPALESSPLVTAEVRKIKAAKGR
jgi:ElaB/YqjD/DUF883 family membrane-anchored ribosome-binding protein